MKNTPAEPPVLTVTQVAEALQVSDDTVRRLAASGKIASHQLPGRGQFVFRPDDVRAYLDGKASQLAEAAERLAAASETSAA